MGSLLVVTGPPGAGKSTLAAKLIEPWRPESAAQSEIVIEAEARGDGRSTRSTRWL